MVDSQCALILWFNVCLLSHVALGDLPSPSATHTTLSANNNRPLWNSTWTDKLRNDLLAKYDKFARPAPHTNATVVYLDFTVKHVEIDEVSSLMILNAWTRMEWFDEKLKWNESDYGGLDELQVAPDEIWLPDISLYNNALGNTIDIFGNTHCVVCPCGRVQWSPPSQFTVYCKLDLRKWPYDQHTCSFYFGSWVYNGNHLIVTRHEARGDSPELDEDLTPMQWTLISAQDVERGKIYYDGCPEPYYMTEVIITVKRSNPAYSRMVFIPAIVCSMMTMAVLSLSYGPDKVMLAGVTAVVESLFLLYFSQQIPVTGIETPLIVEFYQCSLTLVSLSVVTSVLIVNMSDSSSARPVPWFITRALDQYKTIFGGYNSYKWECKELHQRHLVEGRGTESSFTSPSPQTKEWLLLAAALDRLMVILYIVVLLLMITAAAYF